MPYTINVEFDRLATHAEVETWMTNLSSQVPESAKVTLSRPAELRSAEDLNKNDIGSTVTFAVPDGGAVSGTLQNVFKAGRHEVSRVLVVNDIAHLLTYGVVTIT